MLLNKAVLKDTKYKFGGDPAEFDFEMSQPTVFG